MDTQEKDPVYIVPSSYKVNKAIVGGGVYADVPLSLLPWMLWAGRLHAGGHRVAGAGGWRLVLE
jgi:hypothetical protein